MRSAGPSKPPSVPPTQMTAPPPGRPRWYRHEMGPRSVWRRRDSAAVNWLTGRAALPLAGGPLLGGRRRGVGDAADESQHVLPEVHETVLLALGNEDHVVGLE